MLQFHENGKFTILCFGDLHESNNFDGEGKVRFNDMKALMEAALNEFQPDLCVYMGDNCSTRGLDTEEGLAAYRKTVDAITESVRRRNIPFASVFGNHEHDHGNEDKILATYEGLQGCLMRNDAPEITGYANYSEPILSSDGKRTAFQLWFMDSNNLCPDKSVSKYDWVKQDQIHWYEKKAAELKAQNGGESVPALLFQHIPVCEEYELTRKAHFWEIPVAVRGCNTKEHTFYVLKKGIQGYLGEGPCSPDLNAGQFESWKKTGDIIGAVFGHDHMNDFCGTVDGIALMQCKTAGFGCYTDGCRSGVRVITLDENNPRTFQTQMKHFKEFGLRSQLLNWEFRNLTDRQSINLTIGTRVAAGVAAAAGIGYGISKLIKMKK